MLRRVVEIDTPMQPDDFRGLEACLSEAEAALTPATDEQRISYLSALMTTLPISTLDDETARGTRWRVYHSALGDMPAAVLADACRKIAKTHIWFPKPAEIRDAAKDAWAERIKTLSRLKALRNLKIEVRATPQPGTRTPKEIEKIDRLVKTAFRLPDGNRYPDHPGAEYPTFTDGLDAVVSLVERELPGFSWQVGTNGPDATPFGWVGRGYEASHLAATPTLALLLAFLTAMEEKGQ